MIVIDDQEVYFDSLESAIGNVSDGELVINLLSDVEITKEIKVPEGKRIVLKGDGNKVIRRGKLSGDWYTGRMFVVASLAELTFDNIIIDGGNNWVFNKDYYNECLDNYVRVKETMAFISSEDGAPISKNWLVNNSGILNVNNTIIKNYFSDNGNGLFYGAPGSTTNINGSSITNCAITNGGLVSYINGANSSLNIGEGTIIDGNYVGGNGGIFKIYSGGIATMNGGVVKNTSALNSNGVVSMTYGTGSTFILNGGVVSHNTGIYGANNGRNGMFYVHSGSSFIMNGGTIEYNRGYSCGSIDAPDYSNASVILNAGIIQYNETASNYSSRSDLNVQYDYDLVLGEGMVINGNVQISGDLVNNGTVNGDITLKLEGKEDLTTLNGNGVLNGDLVVYHSDGVIPVAPNTTINGYAVNCDVSSEVVVKFMFNGGTDGSAYNYKLADVEKEKVVSVPIITKVGYTFDKWYLDADLTEEWENVGITKSIKVYAGWLINEHNVYWDVDGNINKVVYKYGDVIQKVADPVKNNYTFSGWSNYTEGMTLPDNDITFKALWDANVYTVIFNSNGGSNVNSIHQSYGQKINCPTDPIYEGCKIFDGWYVDSMLTTKYNFDMALTGNLTLYAKWDDNHTWGIWSWYDNEKHVRTCVNDSNHVQFSEHKVDESGYCSICRNYNYQVSSIESENLSDNEKSIIAFTTTGENNNFIAIEIDGVKLSNRDYTIDENSQIIINDVYLRKLESGEHQFKVIYADGEASCEFNVKANAQNVDKVSNNKTYMWCWLWILILIIIIIILYTRFRKKTKKDI